MKKTFTNIFFNDIWEHRTKHLTTDTKKFRKQIDFINKSLHQIQPALIIDCGCGPAEFIQHTNILDYNYLGVDIVEKQIEENKIKYPKLTFTHSNILDYLNSLSVGDVPHNTLFFIKDVIMHWSNLDILQLMVELQRLRVKALLIFKRRGQFRCRRGVENSDDRNLNNKYHEYPVNFELSPMDNFREYLVDHTRTNYGFKQIVLYDFNKIMI